MMEGERYLEEIGQILLPILLCGGILISGFYFVLMDFRQK